MIHRAIADRHVQDSPVDSASSPLRSWRGIRAIAICSGVALMSVLLAGCGGGSSPSVASLGSTATTSPNTAYTPKGNSGSSSQQLQYVQCLQTHGFPNFPEPGPNTPAVEQAMSQIDLNSPQFQKAMKTCEKLLPKNVTSPPAASPKVQAEALKFTNCMRAHGMTDWPDPLPGGLVMVPTGAAAKSLVYQNAAKACDRLLPGA
jgi:hypothetical protein